MNKLQNNTCVASESRKWHSQCPRFYSKRFARGSTASEEQLEILSASAVPWTPGTCLCHAASAWVNESHSPITLGILTRVSLDLVVARWCEDTFYEEGTWALTVTMDLVQQIILKTDYHLTQAQSYPHCPDTQPSAVAGAPTLGTWTVSLTVTPMEHSHDLSKFCFGSTWRLISWLDVLFHHWAFTMAMQLYKCQLQAQIHKWGMSTSSREDIIL
ncbi:uncharacterized protein LOC105909402 isoform X1 [Clupea harengus]|uniref:Uncharacterized protein LOC105909402 isoform X1 n=1 Tax=Clupea harengus TaxID=7950 RepID=A0A6P3WAD1_CLUHA|nr:uncharacterized protein LOC105909402 isoform X1 [Clupea harengus]